MSLLLSFSRRGRHKLMGFAFNDAQRSQQLKNPECRKLPKRGVIWLYGVSAVIIISLSLMAYYPMGVPWPKNYPTTYRVPNDLLNPEKADAALVALPEVGRECTFPRLNPWDDSILQFLSDPMKIDCSLTHQSIFRSTLTTLILDDEEVLKNFTCCYRAFSRVNKSDNEVRYSKSCRKIFSKETKIPASHEFILTECKPNVASGHSFMNSSDSTYTDMFAFVPFKSTVESRIRRSHVEQSTSERKLSVLIIGLDSQSQMNFQRQMTCSHNYLKENLTAIGLQGYTKVGDNTFPNLVPILSGLSVQDLQKQCWTSKQTPFDKCPWIWKNFSSEGYRTSYGEDSVWMGTFNYDKKGFKSPPTHYYLNPFSREMANKLGHEKWGNAKLCYGSQLAFEILLDYIKKTAMRFKKLPYFQFIWSTSLFHDYLNNPRLGDAQLCDTLKFLNEKQYLNETVLILISDHGMRWGPIRSTNQGKIEERMPFAFFAFPPWFRNIHSKKIAQFIDNAENRLTTPFDIHETLKDILHQHLIYSNISSTKQPTRGVSLFREISKTRSCNESGIEQHWCVCDRLQKVDLGLDVVQSGALFLVDTINGMLTNVSQCAVLTLARIEGAVRKIDFHNDDGTYDILKPNPSEVDGTNNVKRHGAIQLQLTFETRPGSALFEATIFKDAESMEWEMSGSISRLNLYHDQSACISDSNAQKYCYCVDLVQDKA